MTQIRHELVDVNGTRLHYAILGQGEPLVLLHGFPQTWNEWRGLMPELAKKYTVIAPDYRGAGQSARPVTGYDKVTMAQDIRALVHSVVGEAAINLVGHDMGSFVAFRYALDHPDEVKKLVLVDAAQPGTALWDDFMSNPRVWHIGFHGKRDLAERLVSGNERFYLETFFADRAYLYDRATEDLDEYVRQYSASGALRAGFEAYRALPDDLIANRESLAKAKLPMPVLVVGGSHSSMGPRLAELGPQIAENYESVTIPRSGHWIAEEQPEAFLQAVTEFLAT